jgi:hypothetical protein
VTERSYQNVAWLYVTVHHFDRMHLSNSAHKLKHEPLLLHKAELRDTMQLLFQVVADELSHPKQRLVLYIEHLVVGEDVRVLVKVKGVLYLINLCLQLIELIIFYL